MRRRPSPKIFIYGVFATCISAALLCYLFLVKQVEKDVSPQASSLRGLKGAQQRLEHLEHELKANRDLIHSVRQHLALVASKSRGGRDGSSGRNFNLLQSCLTEIPDNRNYEVLSVEDIYDSIPFDNADGGVWKQGWDIQVNASRSKQKLRVFVVPHSHNDPGWLKTFDGYFRGQTRHILDNMLKFMFEHEDMKFIWAETSYFAYWWTTINSEQKEKVKLLLSRGQLEIVTGGWVMNDEANTEIFSMINQLIEGHEWLRNEVNVIPRHGWAIDPFGLSPSMAYLLDQMGFDGMVVQRVHYEVKKYLAKKHLLEFHWLQRWQKDDEKRLLAHVTPFYSYDVPHSCGPDPKVCCQFDFRRLPPFKLTCPWKINPTHITNSNVETRSRKLAEQYWKKAMLFKTNTILVPLGDDFRYEHPKEWEYQYKNYKMLFDFMNSSPDLNIEASFGTLADYFESIKRQSSFPSLTGDFFTYSDRDDHYWSGYYTSRPFYKQYDRVLSSYLRSVEILFSFAYLQQLEVTSSPDTRQKLESIRQNLALFQHHDAITGTAKDVVVNDYAIRMFKSLVYSQELVTNLIKSLLKLDSSSNNNLHFLEIYPDHNSLPAPKIVSVSVGSPANIILFNSLPHKRIELICFETSFNSSSYLVKDSNTGHSLQVQSSFLWDRANIITDRLRHCFEAKLDPLSISSFSIESSINGETPSFSHVSLINFDNFQVPDNEFVQKESSDNNIDGDITLESQRIRLILDDYGHLKRIIHIEDGISHEIKMHFVYYGTKVGKADVKSGAYIFMPDKQSAQDLPFDKPLIRVTKGPLYSKVEIIYQKPIELTQSLIILRHSDSVLVENEFHLTKGSFISNKELVMRLSSQVQSHDLFYTDLNGLQVCSLSLYCLLSSSHFCFLADYSPKATG